MERKKKLANTKTTLSLASARILMNFFIASAVDGLMFAFTYGFIAIPQNVILNM